MSAADRCQVLAGITGALALATGVSWFGYVTVGLLWYAVIDLSVTIRADRRAAKLTSPIDPCSDIPQEG
jgi:hypothetical protein